MFSVITIISLFTEIFAAGILISGGMTFFGRFVKAKERINLFLSLLFFFLFLYVTANISSQLMVNLNWKLSVIILSQKLVLTFLIVATIFLWLYLADKFKLKLWWPLTLLVLAAAGGMAFNVWAGAVNLIFREGVIEPLIDFSAWVPVKPFFSLMWGGLFCLAIKEAIGAKAGKKSLLLCSGIAAVLMLGGFFLSFLYVRFGQAGYLAAAWGATLLALLCLLLSEIIPPESKEAKKPWQYLETRILFKLALIFILLIILLLEVTTIVMINIGKEALSKQIRSTYQNEAINLARKVELAEEEPSAEELQAIINTVQLGNVGRAFIVDARGKLLAHPDSKRVLSGEDVSRNEAVRKVLAGKKESGEFRDELGERMVGAFVFIKKYDWGVVVEAPVSVAYYEMRRLETNSLLFVILGIVFAGVVGVFFAQSIERPIKALKSGTEAVSRGELGYRIKVDSLDELGELAKAFNRMTEELKNSQEKLILSEKLASLGTMAAGMAHEIKNPLVSVRTFTQLLQQKWEDKEFRDKFSAIVPHEIERINKIAESLLKFGRPMKPELTKVDVNALLDEVIMLFESECKKHNVVVTKKMAELPMISGDPGQISQAFVNIIKNGIESMDKSGGELLVRTEAGEAVKMGRIQAREGKQVGEEFVWGEEEDLGHHIPVVMIEVTDTGEGISQEQIKNIFDPFFTTKETGTGMGLPITIRIIEEHKGSVRIKSQVGKGTSFILTLPQKL
ncbi:MAG: ATP-binding protein [bacterium]